MTLRVLTLNLWNRSGPWPERAKRIRAWLDRLDPDVVGLQEVLRGPGLDQLAVLFEGRPHQLDFVRAIDFWEDRSLAFGNAIASRWPIREREELLLPAADAERRAALSVTIDAPFGPLCVSVTHLAWRGHHGFLREEQAVAVCDLALRRRPRGGFPTLMMGDWNGEPDSAEIRYVTGLQSLGGRSVYFHDAWRYAGDGGPGLTWSNRNDYARVGQEPDRRIDYVFATPPLPNGLGRIERCRVVCDVAEGGVWPSDHFGVYAELRTAPAAR
jgi:endonuclease/exonuclease/phosphatase family metal-dependent hydrolase